MSDSDLPAAFYERLDAETFAATTATMSPWDERLQHGGPPTALLARAITDAHPRDDMRIARVASEFLGPIPIAGQIATCPAITPTTVPSAAPSAMPSPVSFRLSAISRSKNPVYQELETRG